LENHTCKIATGCPGAGGFRPWAADQGFPFCEILDWSSSAGDWIFLVSRDGGNWFVMTQTNNFPQPGFTRTINEDNLFQGTAEEACQKAIDYFMYFE